MLILTRSVGEIVVINEDIYCKVLGVKGNQVRLAFDAPQHIPIHREEIHKRIQQEKYQDNPEEFLDMSQPIMEPVIVTQQSLIK